MPPTVSIDAGGFLYVLFHLQHQRLRVDTVAAYHDVKAAGLEDGLSFSIHILQLFATNTERHAALLASLQMDALETAQLLHRTGYGCCLLVDIELYNLVTIALTGIADGNAGINGAVALHGVAAQRQVAIAEGGIGQSITEGVEGIVAHLQVVAAILAVVGSTNGHGTTGVQIVVIDNRWAPGQGLVAW